MAATKLASAWPAETPSPPAGGAGTAVGGMGIGVAVGGGWIGVGGIGVGGIGVGGIGVGGKGVEVGGTGAVVGGIGAGGIAVGGMGAVVAGAGAIAGTLVGGGAGSVGIAVGASVDWAAGWLVGLSVGLASARAVAAGTGVELTMPEALARCRLLLSRRYQSFGNSSGYGVGSVVGVDVGICVAPTVGVDVGILVAPTVGANVVMVELDLGVAVLVGGAGVDVAVGISWGLTAEICAMPWARNWGWSITAVKAAATAITNTKGCKNRRPKDVVDDGEGDGSGFFISLVHPR